MRGLKPLFILWLILVAGVSCATPARADIYRWRDASGRLHFTDTPRHTGYTLYLRTPKPRPASLATGTGPAQFQPMIRQYAEMFRLEESLLRAVIKAESDFDPRAVSRKGARGLMQLMPDTAQELGVTDPFDAAQSLYGGGRYLRQQMDRFGNLDLALAAYNAGPSAVERHGGVPPFEETREYIVRVKRYLEHYRSVGSRP